MPRHIALTLRFLYGLAFVAFASMGVLKMGGHWLATKLGVWGPWGFISVDLVVIFVAIWLINKIHRDWPTFEIPTPRARPMPAFEEEISQPQAMVECIRLPSAVQVKTEEPKLTGSSPPIP